MYSPATSGDAYLEMRDAWTLTFDNVGIDTTGNYLLSTGYQLAFESPKTQFIVVNGDTITALEFTAPSITIWLKRGLMIPLKEGTNTVAIYGFWNWMNIDFIDIPNATVLSVDNNSKIPTNYSLSQNFPNPFNPETSIRYSIPKQSHVTIKVFDILGREVTTLVNEEKNVGNYEVKFNSKKIASGIYFYRIQAGDFLSTKKMTVLK
jgi:hypothetical protein